MVIKEWIIEHIVELLSLVVAILGFGFSIKYLIRINKNQKASITNSPNSNIYQIGSPIDELQIKKFREESKKEIVSSNSVLEEENSKKLIHKIERNLDENKSISTIAELSLRLAKKLQMKKDEKWLEKEIFGFWEHFGAKQNKTGIKAKKKDIENNYRIIDAELNIGLKNGMVETFRIPMFVSQSIRQIENWAEKYSKEQRVILSAPPLDIMVETLKADPDKPVPYLVNPASYKKILDEVRLKIIRFLDRARKRI